MLSRDRDLTDADLRLHGVRLVHDDYPPGRRRRVDHLDGLDGGARPGAEYPFGGGESFFTADVPNDREDHVVGHEIPLVIRLKIGARDGGQGLRGTAVRESVGMKAVHQPIEQGAGDVVGILGADLQRRHRLLLLPLDLFSGERGVPNDVGQQFHGHAERILHHDHVDEAQVGAGTGAERSADEVDLIGDLL